MLSSPLSSRSAVSPSSSPTPGISGSGLPSSSSALARSPCSGSRTDAGRDDLPLPSGWRRHVDDDVVDASGPYHTPSALRIITTTHRATPIPITSHPPGVVLCCSPRARALTVDDHLEASIAPPPRTKTRPPIIPAMFIVREPFLQSSPQLGGTRCTSRPLQPLVAVLRGLSPAAAGTPFLCRWSSKRYAGAWTLSCPSARDALRSNLRGDTRSSNLL